MVLYRACISPFLPYLLPQVEVDILTAINHPAVVGLEGAYFFNDKLWIVLELCEGGALDDILLDLETALEERFIKCIAFQMLQALKCCHENNVSAYMNVFTCVCQPKLGPWLYDVHFMRCCSLIN